MKFYGPCLLHVSLTTVGEVKLFAGVPSPRQSRDLEGVDLFDTPLEVLPWRIGSKTISNPSYCRLSPAEGNRGSGFLKCCLGSVPCSGR